MHWHSQIVLESVVTEAASGCGFLLEPDVNVAVLSVFPTRVETDMSGMTRMYCMLVFVTGISPCMAVSTLITHATVISDVRQAGGHCVKFYNEEALRWPGGAQKFRLPSADSVGRPHRAWLAIGRCWPGLAWDRAGVPLDALRHHRYLPQKAASPTKSGACV